MDGLRPYSDSTDIIEDAVELFKDNADYEANVREEMLNDVSFEANLVESHWNKDLYNQRTRIERRPALVVPRFQQFLNQVRNEQRQNKPSIKVSATNDQDVDAAQNRQGIIRHIQYQSNAVDAYQCAFDYAVGPGRGWFKVGRDYESDKSFNQRIVIDSCPKPWNIYPDRMRQKRDYSDMKNLFEVYRLKRETFKKLYPKADIAHWESTEYDDVWFNKDDLQIANFYCIWANKRKLLLLSRDGVSAQEMYEDEIPPEEMEIVKPFIRRDRTVNEPVVMWYKMTKIEVLEKERIPGKYIPFIPVIGYEKEVKGTLNIRGMTRSLIDIQKMYNYWVSYEADVISKAPRTRYMFAAGQIEGLDKYWKNPEQSLAGLPYKPVESGGKMVPPPQTIPYPEIPMAAVNAKAGCVDDMKAVTGIYDPSLGNVSGERSGRAILARQRQSDNANYHYIDNLRCSITHAGRIINDWLSEGVITEGQMVKILGEDNEEDTIQIGGMNQKTQKPIELGDSDFDVTVTMGAAFDTKRQEGTEAILDLIKAVPQITPLIYDIFVKNMDFPGAQEIADRLRKTVPPNVLEEQGGEEQLRMNLQQAMQQVQQDKQVIQMLSQQLQQAMADLQNENADRATNLEKERIKAEADIAVANIKALSDADRETNKMAQFWLNQVNSPAPQQTKVAPPQ